MITFPLLFSFKKNWMYPPSSHGSHIISFLLSVCTDIESLLICHRVATCDCSIASRILVPCCMSWSNEKENETVDNPCLYSRTHVAVCM